METLKKNDYSKWSLKRTVKSWKKKTNLSLTNNRDIILHLNNGC